MGLRALAGTKKNCRRARGWLLFLDEAGFTQKPSVRKTWAPRGKTPVLNHPFNWKKMSVCAGLAYRWDGKRSRLYFRLRPGNFDAPSLIEFIKDLKKHFRGSRVTLIWDGLPAHKSAEMQMFLRSQSDWLSVERLPGYSPNLNPVEMLFGNVKGQELANLCVDEISEVGAAACSGFKRVQRKQRLPFSFLKHTGLSF